MRSGGTSARMVFASFEYTTAPPLKYSLEPACAVRTAARSPPVHDSAAATVSLRRRSREWSAPMRVSSSGRVGGRLAGTKDESDAREKGERGGRYDERVRGRAQAGRRPRRRRQEPEGRGDLQDGLGLAVETRAQLAWRAGAELDRDELAAENEEDGPHRRDPPQGEGGEGPDDEHLVGERIERRTERGRGAAAAREGTVKRIGRGRHKEGGQRDVGVADGGEVDHRDDKKRACHGQCVRERY